MSFFFFLLFDYCILDLFLGRFEVFTDPLLFRLVLLLALLLRFIPESLSLVTEVRSRRFLPATYAAFTTLLLIVLVTGRQVLYEGAVALTSCLVAQPEALSGCCRDWWLVGKGFAGLMLLINPLPGLCLYSSGARLLLVARGNGRFGFVNFHVLLCLCLSTGGWLLVRLLFVRFELDDIYRGAEI